MTFKIWDGSTWRDPSFVRRWNGSSWVDVGQASKWDGSSWVQVWPLIRVAITDQVVGDLVVDPADATAQYSLGSDGVASSATSGGSAPISGEWRVSGSSGDYQVRATLQSGSLTSGTTGTWLSLSTGREWSVARTSIGETTAVLLIEIRDATTLTVLDSATVTLTAEVQI